MESDLKVLDDIKCKIYNIRGKQVMLDSDLAELYNVETKVFNQAVKRNIDRFPIEFRFKVTEKEFINLRSQIVTSSGHGGRRYLPCVFTEQGVAMLSAVLRSDVAVSVSIRIIKVFVQMRKLIANNTLVHQRLNELERKQLEADLKFEKVFKAIEAKDIIPDQGIFFDGQIYDAYVFVSKLIKSAKQEIILIDNYIDESVLTLLSKRKQNCIATIYTKSISKQLALDLKKHNEQYPEIQIKLLIKSHDRFLIIDQKTIYHISASLKDLGKKWFAFSKININPKNLLYYLTA